MGQVMCHYYRFLLSADEGDELLSERFFSELREALGRCGESATVNLFTTPDYRSTILTEKLQRLILECSEEALPQVEPILQAFPAIEILPPAGDDLLCLIGTSKVRAGSRAVLVN